jgi:hypothetical protein
MPFIGNKPSAVPLTSADIADSIITSAKIVDATITNSDVASSIITGQTAETSIAGGDSVLIYDDSASALRKMTRTNFVSGLGGLTEADIFRVNTTFTGDGSPIASNWERADDTSAGLLGTGMSQSSGVFTFPSTGYYLVRFFHNFYHTGDDRSVEAAIYVSTDGGSSYDQTASGLSMLKNITGGLNSAGSSVAECLLDVTSTANVKVTFYVIKQNSGTTSYGDSGSNRVYATFIKLGDT